MATPFRLYQWHIAARVLLLFAALCGAAYSMAHEVPAGLLGFGLAAAFFLAALFRFVSRGSEELEQFAQSVQYRDFSRHFNERQAPPALRPLRQVFNQVNATFRDISREKETQYVYLQKILELVDTGIISYEQESGDIVWMNEAAKRLLDVPYLKSIGSLERRDPGLYQEIRALRPGERKVAAIGSHTHSACKALLSAAAFQTGELRYHLVAFQNINEALDETESQAWQKLLSVLTHEIMNSVAPIASLAETLKDRLHAGEASDAEDIALGIDTIIKRSRGLLRFADTYRSFSRANTAQLGRVYARDLFENLYHLMQPTLAQKNIAFDILLKDPDLQLELDRNLIEQVLINLLLNAMAAVEGQPQPHIALSALAAPNTKGIIRISDNGTGIPPELMDKIFIPFFSTRKEGSGIGLSLSKQIMLLHRGNVQVQSAVGEGSVFSLVF